MTTPDLDRVRADVVKGLYRVGQDLAELAALHSEGEVRDDLTRMRRVVLDLSDQLRAART